MYKVLIVDDERIIRDGIFGGINWENCGLVAIGTAEDGEQAYGIIKEQLPHIVITDIKMPIMNGIELIEKVSRELPDITFVILSGYGEFNFAREAMKYGVKHYILKPCNEEEIISVLKKVVSEKSQKESKDNFFNGIYNDLKKVLPQVEEQFLREFLLLKSFSAQELDYFLRLFEIRESKFKLIVLKINNDSELIEKFALKSISKEVLKEENVYISAILEENIVLLVKSIELDEITELLVQIKNVYNEHFNIGFSAAISNENSFGNIPEMYHEAQECLKNEFYLGEGSIITKRDIAFSKDYNTENFNIDYKLIADYVKAGNRENIDSFLQNFFQFMKSEKMEIEVAKTYCIQLFLVIIRQGDFKETSIFAREISMIQDMVTLNQIHEHISDVAYKIASKNYDDKTKQYSMLISKIIQTINDNIGNSGLTLYWIAKEVLFMNENYLGKLFYKETGEKFSQYVMRVRMEKAKELIASSNNYKVYEITKMLGFAENTQYFSQVFKKATGYTPSEYKNHICE
jgi:two-component system response regulator YesN